MESTNYGQRLKYSTEQEINNLYLEVNKLKRQNRGIRLEIVILYVINVVITLTLLSW